ncbi:hypothetical protein B5C34_14450 [Pacificimonas flava]|uniref:Transposase n=2 Tax=Pacificimonas TaxID=1960290 RepID=A0A219B9P8_9SPHN|nr:MULTISPECIES: transposase [Pacificimonas]MBZ6380025.1 transposase [Pacificimonas aurantium]OWV34539.1 hypothetical protein B5C34_14450 [Pacificimonas flava]
MRGLEGAVNGAEEIHGRKAYRDAARGWGAAVAGREDGAISRSLGISKQSYYRLRREYSGLKVSQARRLKDLEKENQRLRKAVSDLMLDASTLKGVVERKY